MKRQNDWYTGSDYYLDYREKQIEVTEKSVGKPSELFIHEQVILIFIREGLGIIEVNGISYEVKKGSFLCLYTHHFFRYVEVRETISAVYVKFYIGNFMFMCWERHPENANATLVYDTKPIVLLDGPNLLKVTEVVNDLIAENEEKRFAFVNMITYLTMELHAYFCRFALEGVTKDKSQPSVVWQLIPKIILSTGESISLNDLAREANLSSAHLNQKIKLACGYTFFQLRKYGKVLNACALLHFPELSINYISDLLNFSSTNDFDRVFRQYTHFTPREYQVAYISGKEEICGGYGSALLFLQYIHLNFMDDISLETISMYFHLKEYTIREIFENIYKVSFNELLEQVRITYACAFLSSTKKSITEISNTCGFDSISTFQRAFKKHMDQTPREYRSLMNTNI